MILKLLLNKPSLIAFAIASILFSPLVSKSQDLVEIITPSDTVERKFRKPLVLKWDNGDFGSSDIFTLIIVVDGGAFTTINTLLLSQLTNTGNQSSFNWTIPDFGSNADSQVRIRVWNQTQQCIRYECMLFRVYYEPSVSISIPTGLEEKKFGESYSHHMGKW